MSCGIYRNRLSIDNYILQLFMLLQEFNCPSAQHGNAVSGLSEHIYSVVFLILVEFLSL